MDAEMLSGCSKVAIFNHEGVIDLEIHEAHFKEFIKTIAHLLILQVSGFDPGHVDLLWCQLSLSHRLLLRYKACIGVRKGDRWEHILLLGDLGSGKH